MTDTAHPGALPRVGLIGCGGIAQVHAAVLSSLKDRVQFVAACDPVAERRQAMASQYGLAVYASPEEMLAAERLDTVHLCTPHDLHVPQALMALEHGLNVLSEKPVGISRGQLSALKQGIEKSCKRYGVCLQNRYLPAIRRAQELLSQNAIGTVLGSRANVSWKRGGAYYGESPWRGTWLHEGGSAMINQAIHTLDLQCLLCGHPTQMTGTMHNMSLTGQTEAEDSCQIRMVFESGAIGLFNASIGYGLDAPVLIEINGDKGALRLEADRLYVRYGEEAWREEAMPVLPIPGKVYWGSGHLLLITDYYRTLAEGTPFPIGFKEGTKALMPLLRLYEYWRDRLGEKLPEIDTEC